MITLTVLLSALAFLHFAFCSNSYFRTLAGRPRTPTAFRLLQATAWLCLLLSIVPAVLRWEFEIGLTTWFGLITVSALLVATLVNYGWPAIRLLWRLSPWPVLLANRGSRLSR